METRKIRVYNIKNGLIQVMLDSSASWFGEYVAVKNNEIRIYKDGMVTGFAFFDGDYKSVIMTDEVYYTYDATSKIATFRGL